MEKKRESIKRDIMKIISALIFCSMLLANSASAEKVFFLNEGKLVSWNSETKSSTAISAKKGTENANIYEIYGTLADGRILAGIGNPEIQDGYRITKGVDIGILSADGDVEKIIMSNALRAWPAPIGEKAAIISPDNSVFIYADGEVKPLAFENRTTLAAWSPDAEKIIFTAYPPDWSPVKLNNPKNTEEFLRLINSDLYLYEIKTGTIKQITDAPGYDYSAVFSPDGNLVMFISSRDGSGAFFTITPDGKNLKKITNLEKWSYDIPVGRSDTFIWSKEKNTIIYECQIDQKTSGIRMIKPDGSGAKEIGTGKSPRLIDKGSSVAWISDSDGKVSTADISGKGENK